MKYLSALILLLVCAACSPEPSDAPDEADLQASSETGELTATSVIGDWSGQLNIPGGPQLWLIFHVTEGEDGALAVTMDSPAQSVNGIPGEGAKIEEGVFSAEFPALGATFTMRPGEGDEMNGVWLQGMPMPFTLKPGDRSPELDRPQEPKSQDYVVEAVRVPGAEDGVMLAGELTLPEGEGPFPAAVLISGSGPQDRNEELAGHKPFLVIADDLTRKGYAVLRYDDRGFGESTGDFGQATTEDFALDAAAALAYLKADPRIDPERTAYIGHSEGGLAAPLATQTEEAAALVLLAGPAVTLGEVMLEQSEDISRAAGASDSAVEASANFSRKTFNLIREGMSEEEMRAALKEIIADSGLPPSLEDSTFKQIQGPWLAWALDYDPVPALEAYQGPVLALYGSKDLQVSAQTSAPLMEEALSNPQSEVVVLDGLNHLFQPAGTGSPDEYISIETTFDPVALDTMSDWLDDVLSE
ncbi:alpha/beta fold hydrolase [Henriciella sp. AS95]|uniref:alpha/beta hydrolase family protein n=1 Tax=Henriciella sp. AS95 TaxID=3135782 RepID=UPI003177B7C3